MRRRLPAGSVLERGRPGRTGGLDGGLLAGGPLLESGPLGGSLGLDLGTQTLHCLVLRTQRGQLGQRLLRARQVAGIAGPQSLRHESDLGIRRVLRMGITQRQRRQHHGGSERSKE